MNIVEFLETHEVEYWTSGKNVSKGYIAIQCMFCGDTSNHLGIRLKDLRPTCWKCGSKYFPSVIAEIVGCSLGEAKQIAKGIDNSDLAIKNKPKYLSTAEKILPADATKEFPKVHLRYLRERGFNPRKLIRKYNLHACYLHGKYRYRIIIPVIKRGRIVTFTSRDVTDSQQPKYLMASYEESAVDPAEAVFNIDSVKPYSDAFLVEGPFDVFKMGDGAFCFMGVKFTSGRLLQVAEKKIDRLFIFFDSDQAGYHAGKRMAQTVSPLVKHVEIVRMKGSARTKGFDPGDMSRDDVRKLKAALNFKD